MKAAGASFMHFCWFVKDKQELKQIINLVPWLSLSQSLSCIMEVNIIIMCPLFHPGIKERGKKEECFVLVPSVDVSAVQLDHCSP